MAFIIVVLEHFINYIISTFSLALIPPPYPPIPRPPPNFMERFPTVTTWNDRSYPSSWSLENNDIIQEIAVLGEIRGPPAPAAGKRRCMGKYMGAEQTHVPSFQHFLNQTLCKWLLCAELMDGVNRFTALRGKEVHSSCTKGRTVFCYCLTLCTHYLNLVSPNPHSGRGSNNHAPFAMPFMSLQTCIMLPFPPTTSPAAWGGRFCIPTIPADLSRPLPVLLPPFWAVRTVPVHHMQVVETPWTCTVAQWYSLFCFPFPSYFLTFAFLLWPLMKKLKLTFSWHYEFYTR